MEHETPRLGLDTVVHILRNPWGHDYERQRAARLEAAERLEELTDAYTNMRQWAEQNGLDTVARAPFATEGGSAMTPDQSQEANHADQA
jgi:hypothetical protein